MQETVLETKEIKLLKPHSKQEEFIDSPAKYRAFISGVGTGKTMIGCSEMILFALDNPKSLNVITAPTYRLLADATERTFLDICPRLFIKEINKSNNSVKLTNDAEVLFRSTDDPEHLRGPNLASFYMDEAALSPEMAWKILLGRLRQVGFNHRARINSTPKGFNWIHKEFVQKKYANYEIIKAKSADNPYLSKEFIEGLKESYAGLFLEQELYGEFVAPEGVVYRNFSRFRHVVNLEGKKFKDIIYGVDWGWQHGSVILAIGMDSDNRFYVVDEFYRSHVLLEELVKIAQEFQEKYGKGTFYADPSQPEHIQVFNNAGLNCVEANNEVLAGINKVSTALETKSDNQPALFISPKCARLIMEFENYSYATPQDGKPQQDKPLKIYDDCLDGLRYAISSLGIGEMRLLKSDGGAFF